MATTPEKTPTTDPSPRSSPSKKEIDAATEAVNHFAQGKRHLVVGDIASAVNSLQEACRLLAEQYGETASECGDAYFYYGRALLEMARMESGVLGNALEGVPEGEDLESSQVESPEKLTEDEQESVAEEVAKALEENLQALDIKGNKSAVKNLEKMDTEQEIKKDVEESTEPKTEITVKDAKADAMDAETNEKGTAVSSKGDSPSTWKDVDKGLPSTSGTTMELGMKDDGTVEESASSELGESKASTSKDSDPKASVSKLETKTTTTPAEAKLTTQSPVSMNLDESATLMSNNDKGTAKESVPSNAERENEEQTSSVEMTDLERKKTVEKNGTTKDGSTEGEEEDEDEEENDGDGEGGEGEDEGNSQDGESQEEGNGASQEGDGEKTEEDEEDISNLQLAWEMLELAKVIFQKQTETKPEVAKKVAEVYLKLGEVGLESENYDQGIEDFKQCLEIQERVLEKDSRCLAETHYQLGVAHSFTDDFDKAIESFKSATLVIETRIENLKNIMKEKANWTEEQKAKDAAERPDPFYTEQGEIDELNVLLPELKEKIVDMEQVKKDSKEKLQKIAKEICMAKAIGGSSPAAAGSSSSSGDSRMAAGSSQTGFDAATSSGTKTEAKPISHLLVRKKQRKPEEDADGDMKKLKRENGEVHSTNGTNIATNGEAQKESTKETTLKVQKV